MPPKTDAVQFRRTLRTTARKSNQISNPKTLPKSTPPSSSRRPEKPTTAAPSTPVESVVSSSPQSAAGNQSNLNSKSTNSDCGGDASVLSNLNSNPKSTSSEGVSKVNQNQEFSKGEVAANVLNLNTKSTSSEDGSGVKNKNPKSTSSEGVSKTDQKLKSSRGKVAADVLNLNPKSNSNEGIKESTSSEDGSGVKNKNPKSTSSEGVSKTDQKVKSSRGKVAADVLNLDPKSNSNEGIIKESTGGEDGSDVLNKNPKSARCEGVSKSDQKLKSGRGKVATDVLNLNPKSNSNEGIIKENQRTKSNTVKVAANVLNLNPKSTSNEGVNVLKQKSDSTSSDAADVLSFKCKSGTDESAGKGNQLPKSNTQTASMELKCSPKSSGLEEIASIDSPPLKICSVETLIGSVAEARPVVVEAKSVGERGVATAPAVTKKTVMKKTMRVVKRVVKKKVPKKKEQIASLNDESHNLETSKDGKMPDSSGSLKNMGLKSCTTPVESEIMKIEIDNPIETVLPEIENLKTDATLVASELMELENDNPIDTVLPETENFNAEAICTMDSEEINDDADIQMSDKIEEDIQARVCDSLSEDHAVIKNEKLSETTGSEAHLKDQKDESETEDAKSESQSDEEDEEVKEEVIEDNKVVVNGSKNDVGPSEAEDAKSESQSDEEDEEVKEEVIEDNKVVVNVLKNDVGPSDSILMSGELEALERRRKRKIEIFVGGLEKEAKEEDIRKAFEQAGEITEVRIVFSNKTGKKKGFAFVRFASAADAKNAVTKYPSVQICGKKCGVSANEGNDTLFIGNINKQWKNNDLIKLLKDMGIEKIDKVTIMPDPKKIGWNRGFAFLELETVREAQFAYNKLQNKDLLGKYCRINVAWADPLIEPDEEEILKLKSVYVEYLPLSWDEKKAIEYFSRFGEIGSVTLAKNLRNSKRKDFAFVKYTTREAALSCIEAFSRDQLNDESTKLKLRVSLAKPIPKAKQVKRVSNPARNEFPEERRKPLQSFTRPREKGSNSGSKNYGDIRPVESSRSTNYELVHLLRQQASWRQPEPFPAQGGPVVDLDHSYSSPGRKRPFHGDDAHYSDPRGYPRPRFVNTYSAINPRYNALPQNVGSIPLPPHHQQVGRFIPEPFYGVEDYPSYVQRREPAPPYHGSNAVYRRY